MTQQQDQLDALGDQVTRHLPEDLNWMRREDLREAAQLDRVQMTQGLANAERRGLITMGVRTTATACTPVVRLTERGHEWQRLNSP